MLLKPEHWWRVPALNELVSTASEASAARASTATATARVAASVDAIPRIVTEARVPTAGMVITNECEGSQQVQ